ncbi:hypothetical protein RHSIM_Rhsim06G0113300 [Rhododendron simsii]|uniref:Exocyst subunit Exo70 family protein n=1 Tax=Rhododendron simsii TaxID=118357 RepID=A0A834GQZ5_RHOSS|nr:hypothetical protein RHSIM_Rhsim06G0113300 [Rhododendron simsii]
MSRETRAAVLEQSLRKLGVEKLGKEDVQRMQWEVLEAKIGNWIHFMRISVKLLFDREKKVCDQIFEGVDSLKEQCFADVTATSVAVLLSFGEAIAKSKRSPEKLFVLLDMYELMRELQPEVMAFVVFHYVLDNGNMSSQISNFSRFIPSALNLSFVLSFLNVLGILNGSKLVSEAKDLLGDDWVQIHRRIVQQHANQYKRISWSKILQCLTVQGLSSSSGGQLGSDSGNNTGLSRAMVKERFKTFNIQFEELHQRQSQWSVPDSELRKSLRLAVAEG